MVTVTINGTPRTDTGKKATKAVRVAGLIPCVLYGINSKNVHFTVTPREVRDVIYTGEFRMAEVNVDGKSYRCIMKDVQFHPVNDSIRHIDFHELTDGKKIKVEVPLTFEGVSPGVRNGGKFIQSLRKIKVRILPENLIDKVVADISKLKMNQSIRIRDIQNLEGVEILNPGALPVASVVVPRTLKDIEEEEEEEAAAAAAAAAETEEGAEETAAAE